MTQLPVRHVALFRDSLRVPSRHVAAAHQAGMSYMVTCLLPAAKLSMAIVGLSAGLRHCFSPVTLLGSGPGGATGLGSSGIAFWLSDALRGLATTAHRYGLLCLQRSLARRARSQGQGPSPCCTRTARSF